MKEKHYKVYLNESEIDSNNNYQAKYIGQAKGHIDSGAVVMSNSTKGNGNVIGVIKPQKTGIFNLSGDILTKPTGEKMIFQNKTGSHDLSFLTSMVDFILPTPISNASGKTFEGIGGNKGYLMSFVHEGEDKQVTITNESVTDEIVNTAMDPTLNEILPSSTVSAANTEIDSFF